ncbi:hypothetical protein [Fodinicola acaciae]|uniref:hypothetical protein n=1 Tax=Fodinicola acaciae TaxID=2681555 RepID=UPI0013D38FCC|nr:hypothetical protein [Fodinicola acaciae]
MNAFEPPPIPRPPTSGGLRAGANQPSEPVLVTIAGRKARPLWIPFGALLLAIVNLTCVVLLVALEKVDDTTFGIVLAVVIGAVLVASWLGYVAARLLWIQSNRVTVGNGQFIIHGVVRSYPLDLGHLHQLTIDRSARGRLTLRLGDARMTGRDGFSRDSRSATFPNVVALLWRWSGDRRFLNDMDDTPVRAMRYVSTLDADHGGWPEGWAM